jgi:SET domain-containing protein
MRTIPVCVIASIREGQVKLKNTFSHPLLRKATKNPQDQEGEMIKKGENKIKHR